jgi:ATP-dependent DNA helicase RecQ
MASIIFFDTEIDVRTSKMQDIGAVGPEQDRTYHGKSIQDFGLFLKGATYVCGHNILKHDLKYIKPALKAGGLTEANAIDTLYLSPLLFPQAPYHALMKDDKLCPDELNNPLADALRARDLFYDELNAFAALPENFRQLYYSLLKDHPAFQGFFRQVPPQQKLDDIPSGIFSAFPEGICALAPVADLVAGRPAELAYALSLARVTDRHSITPRWVSHHFPAVENVLSQLRHKPCYTCGYCQTFLDVKKGLKRYFNYDSFRTYEGIPLQEQAAKAAVEDKSLLAIFPTGGGKSITFQVPALMAADASRSLTVVISPLQSLMKDQVDNLEQRHITEAVTINGSLDPLERADAYERVASGRASILYISPESLRSPSMERLIAGRQLARFVIDEAHCFSAWGQDFRVDYLYIGEFIRKITELKQLDTSIPVSCFTATAKRKVEEDILAYFKEALGLRLEVYRARTERKNLHYHVLQKEDEDKKYQTVRDLVESRAVPTIVYVSRVHKAEKFAAQLREDGLSARHYHGQMKAAERRENQTAFIQGEVQVMFATSAFGMGVDKKDVGLVIHFDISDSLENYVQEAGRAGRDENLSAECFILFSEEDLDKHFLLLNQTKVDARQVQQVWKAIKEMTRFRSTLTHSALDIAREAGWGGENYEELEQRVKTAVASLEEAGYVKRGLNAGRVYADSIQTKTAQEAIDRIYRSGAFSDKQKEHATRIIKSLVALKRRKAGEEETAEGRIDHLSERLGILEREVIEAVNLMRQEEILADQKDLFVYLKHKSQAAALEKLQQALKLELFLLTQIKETEEIFNLKELNELANEAEAQISTLQKITNLLNFWSMKGWVHRVTHPHSSHHIKIGLHENKPNFIRKTEKRHRLVRFALKYLYTLAQRPAGDDTTEPSVNFSVLALKKAYGLELFTEPVTQAEVEDALLFLQKAGVMHIDGGFMVSYQRLTIDRIENNSRKQYTQDDHQKLSDYYKSKVQQIHIVGEYAKRMLQDYHGALEFVNDYFTLNYSQFLKKYFPGSREGEINRSITVKKFKKIFGDLSPAQLGIVNEQQAPFLFVAAGPGSGKTKVLAHKLAALLLMEEVKAEQLLMLTFSRAAATEFKKRLFDLVGNVAALVSIKTFHAFCFDMLGKQGNIDKSDTIIVEAIEAIRNSEVEPSYITRTALVIDEAQDMTDAELRLIEALMNHNEGLRLIAVGDDDQNIFEFRGANTARIQQFLTDHQAKVVPLLENYRSAPNLVAFTSLFASTIHKRIKSQPALAHKTATGVLRVINYTSPTLIEPLIKDFESMHFSGSVAVLTRTNSQAMEVLCALNQRSIPARLIGSNDGFDLFNLLEVRYFWEEIMRSCSSPKIEDEAWNQAKTAHKHRFADSANKAVAERLIEDFEQTNPKRKFRTDLEVFIRESRMEDFLSESGEVVSVSTIHKAKGKEFDNVVLLADDSEIDTDEKRRVLYVGMTRARSHLTIHTRAALLGNLPVDGLQLFRDREMYSSPQHLAIPLTLEDVWLDFFIGREMTIRTLQTGDALFVNGKDCFSKEGYHVAALSKKYQDRLAAFFSKGYVFESAHVQHLVYWKKEGTDYEALVVLPWIQLTLAKPV